MNMERLLNIFNNQTIDCQKQAYSHRHIKYVFSSRCNAFCGKHVQLHSEAADFRYPKLATS